MFSSKTAENSSAKAGRGETSRALITGVTKAKLTFPSSRPASRHMGYRGLNWKQGEIAKVVNEVLSTYVNNKLPPISEAADAHIEMMSAARTRRAYNEPEAKRREKKSKTEGAEESGGADKRLRALNPL